MTLGDKRQREGASPSPHLPPASLPPQGPGKAETGFPGPSITETSRGGRQAQRLIAGSRRPNSHTGSRQRTACSSSSAALDDPPALWPEEETPGG